MGQKENLSGGGGGGSAVGRRRLQTSAEASPRRRHASSIWPTSSSSSSFALVLFVLSVVAACFFFSSTSASASFLPLGAATGESRTQQQLPEWPLEAVGSFSSELLNGDSSRLSAPVDVDELATWFPPALVDEARRTVVSLSPVGRGLDIDTPAGPAAGSGGILLDSSALLVGARGKALNGALAALVPAGTRFVLTSRRAVSSGFASYEIALSDGRKVAARLVYVDAFYPVAVMVVVAEREGEEEAATATAKVAAAAGAGSPLVPAAAASQKVDPASLPAATLYPPPEDDARVVGLGGGTATEAEEQESRPPLSAPPSAASSAETVVVEPNDPLLFLGHSPDSRLASTTTTTTTFVGYVSDLRAAFPRTRTPGRGVRGIIARALVARRSPGPGGGAFDVSGRLFGLDVDRDVRGVVAASDKKAEVYVLPAIYLRDALARAVSASLKESLLLRSEGDAAASSSSSSLSFRRPRADGGFAATLVPLGVAVDRYKLNTHIAEMLRSDPRLSGWPNAGGTVPKVIKVAGVDAGSEGEGGEHDGVRAGDLVVGVVVEESSASAASGNSSVTRLLGDDLHALDDAFARAVAAARAAEGGGGALASAGDDGWGAELAAAATSSSSSFLARPSPASPPEASLPPSPSPPAAALVKLVVSRHGELRTVSAAAVELAAAPAKPERVLLWARCRFVDPPASARRLYQFAGPGVALAACDPESPLSAVVNADPREEDEAPTTTGAPPPSKTPVVVTAIGGAPTPNLAALVRLLSSRASPAGKNTTVAYRSIHTGRDSYAYVEGVSFDAGKDESSERQPFREFVFSGRARSWVLLAPLADGEEEGNRARARSSSSSSASLLPVDAEDLKARAAPAKGGKGKGQAAGASASASSFVSRGKTSAAAAALPLSPEDPSDNDEENQMARGPLAKPSSLSNASDWLSLAAKALGKAPVHASQSTWGSPEALLRIKQQAVQVSINDALPLEHTDATPSAVGTGFVVEATLGIIATNAHVCGPTIGGWEVMFFDGSTTPARQLWYSPSQDIAFLAVDPAAIPFPNSTATIASWTTISDADRPALGAPDEMEPLLTVGSPARFAFTLLQGVYLGYAYRASDEVGRWRTRNYLKVRTLIQSVAGSSGGAVLNRRGEIVAIHFAGGSNSQFVSQYGASPYLWNSFEVAGDYVKRAVGFYKRLYGVGEGGSRGGGVVVTSDSGGATAAVPSPSFLGRTEPIRGASGLVLDLVPLESAVTFFGMPRPLAEEAATAPDAPRPRSAMVVASFEPGAPTRSAVEKVLQPGDILWSVAIDGGKEEKIGGDLIRLDELSGLAVERALEESLAAGAGGNVSTSAPPSHPSLSLAVLRRGELLRNVTLPVYDLTADRVRRALGWNGALFHDLSDRTRNYYQLDDSSGGGGGGGEAGRASKGRPGVFVSHRADGAAWPRFYHSAAGGGPGRASTAFAKYIVYEVDGAATPDLDALIAVACSAGAEGGRGGGSPPPTPAVVVARDLQDDAFPGGEAMESPVSQGGLTAVEPPRLFEWDPAELVWRQRAAC